MKNQNKPPLQHNDLRHEIEIRALEKAEDGEMILEGKAIVYGDKTKLFTMDKTDYFEIIEKGCLVGADMSDVFLKYNHSDTVMVLARTKNGTLSITDMDDAAHVRARLANTSAGKDLYELVKRGDIDKMSFAFTEAETNFDELTHTWTVRKIKKLYDVAAVAVPAYPNTELYARRKDELESRLTEVETLKVQRKRIEILNKL